jgi:hypothetical protein
VAVMARPDLLERRVNPGEAWEQGPGGPARGPYGPFGRYAAPRRVKEDVVTALSGDESPSGEGTVTTGTTVLRRQARPTVPIAGRPYCP